MSTKIINIKTSIITIICILSSMGAMAQAYSSGGGSEVGYKSTLGNQNTASGNYSLAAGWGNQAIGQTSFALGYYSKAQGLNSMALGMYSCSQNAYGITIGRGLSSTKPLSNTTNGIMLGMYSNVPTLYITTSSGENRTGKIGIGNITSPSAKLHIKADNGERADLMLEATGTSAIYFKNTNNSISLTGNIMTLSASGFSYTNGNVAIGTMPNNDYKLAVKGVIRSEEVVVELMTSWPDYVFASDYSLPKLNEVKAFVNKNGHLPGLPSASQVSEEGLGLGDINAKLLEKIEELTLYIIEQEERIQKLEEKLNACH